VFGQQLRRQRERAGISLDTIARRTNVMASLFAALEEGDCSRWPPGVYGRGFLRGYALVVGLDPDEVIQEAAELYPLFRDDPRALPIRRGRDELRLRLDAEAPAIPRPLRALLAFVSGMALAGLAGAIGVVSGAGFWAPAAIALSVCYAVTLVLVGRPTKAPLTAAPAGLALHDAPSFGLSDGLEGDPFPVQSAESRV
jgi:transcriptional regulator with XRE-family HTH domain